MSRFLCIFPFVANVASADDLAEGFAMDVAAAVSLRSTMPVLPWRSARALARPRLAARLAAHGLPRLRLDGRFDRNGSRIALSAVLRDAAAGIDLWRAEIAGAVEDLAALRDRLAGMIAGSLDPDGALGSGGGSGGASGGGRLAPVLPVAYEFLLIAQVLLERGTEAANAAANYLLLQAAEAGGAGGRVAALAGRCAAQRKTFGWPAIGNDAEVRAAARIAATVFPDDPFIQAAAASTEAFLASHVDEAIAHVDRALYLAPNDPDAIALSAWLRCTKGDFATGQELFRQAIALNPLDVRPRLRLRLAEASVHLEQGHGEIGDEICANLVRRREGRAADPAALSRALFLRSLVHDRKTPTDETRQFLEQALELAPRDVASLHNLGQIIGRKDEPVLARQLLERAIAERLPFHPAPGKAAGGSVEPAGGTMPMTPARRRSDARLFNDLGVVLLGARLPIEAEQAFRQSSEIDAKFVSPVTNLGYLLLGQDRWDESLDMFRRSSLLDDSPNARHMMAALSKENVPSRAPDDYVETLFDDYASTFDHSLVNVLKYKAPDHIRMALEQARAPAGDLDVLDAGCGTGLCGVFLKPYARRLVGVDLSSGMLQRARVREIYDDLEKAELTAFLMQSAAGFDLVVAADVLVYFGDLAPVFSGAATALRPGGRFVFTVERLADDAEGRGFRIERSGRYAQTADYLRRTAERFGFAVDRLDTVVLRMEAGSPVQGYVVSLSLSSGP